MLRRRHGTSREEGARNGGGARKWECSLRLSLTYGGWNLMNGRRGASRGGGLWCGGGGGGGRFGGIARFVADVGGCGRGRAEVRTCAVREQSRPVAAVTGRRGQEQVEECRGGRKFRAVGAARTCSVWVNVTERYHAGHGRLRRSNVPTPCLPRRPRTSSRRLPLVSRLPTRMPDVHAPTRTYPTGLSLISTAFTDDADTRQLGLVLAAGSDYRYEYFIVVSNTFCCTSRSDIYTV